MTIAECAVQLVIDNWPSRNAKRCSRAISDFENFENFQKFPKFPTFLFFFKIFPLKIKIFKKPYNMLEVNGWLICTQNFKSISSKMAEIWRKTCQKQALFTSFRDLTVIFLILFLTDFDASKSVLGSFFAFFAKIWPKNTYRSSKSRFFWLDLFYLVTWDDRDHYYGRKAQ